MRRPSYSLLEEKELAPAALDVSVGGFNLAGSSFSFQEVTNTIEVVTEALATSIKKVKPDKATVEIGFDITVKEGKLTTLIVEGSGKANLKLTLQWGN